MIESNKSAAQQRFEDDWSGFLSWNYRASMAIDQTGRWKGFLNEAQFARNYVAADRAGQDSQKEELLRVQEARRVSYAGWKLAACVGLANIHTSLARCARSYAHLNPDERLDAPDGFETNAVTILRSRDGANDDSQYLASLPVTQRLVNLHTDETQGGGVAAIDACYQAYMTTGWSYTWEGDFEPFPGDSSRAPFTLIQYANSDPLLGASLAAEYESLGPLNAWGRLLFDAKGLDDQSGELGSDHGCMEGTDRQLFQAMMLGKRRRAALRLVKKIESEIERLTAFCERLQEFIGLHARGDLSRRPLSPVERLVAKYNCLAAAALGKSMLKRSQFLTGVVMRSAALRLEREPPQGYFGWWTQFTDQQLCGVERALYSPSRLGSDPLLELLELCPFFAQTFWSV